MPKNIYKGIEAEKGNAIAGNAYGKAVGDGFFG